MTHWKLWIPFICGLAVLLVALPPDSSDAQGGGAENGVCPGIVESALESVEDVCTGLNRNETCYGYNRIDAVFWETREDLEFNQPSDRVPLASLRSIATTRLDLESGLWGVAAMQLHTPDLPEVLPGQAVMFLLMGDASLENTVPPEEAAAPVTPVHAVTTQEIELYTSPNLNANMLGRVPNDTRLQLVGLDETGEWGEVLLAEGNRAWVLLDAVEAEDTLNDLPVTFGEDVGPRYGPMQAFYFTTSLAGPSCDEAPDALVVQSPEGLEVAFNINGMDVTLGSTVIFTTTTLPDREGTPVLVIVLVEGHVRIVHNGQVIILSEPGQTFAITLNEEGLIDEDSEPVRLFAEPLSAWIENACENALRSHIFAYQGYGLFCGTELTYYTPDGFLVALQPGSLPLLGGQPGSPSGNSSGGPLPLPLPPAPPFQWPLITRPVSQTALVGGGTHQVIWTGTPGANSYRLDVLPDTTNLTGYSASYTTADTFYHLPLEPMPSRPNEGWGYFLRVIPLNDAGAPMAPEDQAPLVWIVRRDPEPTPPPTLTPSPTDFFGNDYINGEYVPPD